MPRLAVVNSHEHAVEAALGTARAARALGVPPPPPLVRDRQTDRQQDGRGHRRGAQVRRPPAPPPPLRATALGASIVSGKHCCARQRHSADPNPNPSPNPDPNPNPNQARVKATARVLALPPGAELRIES